jgi:hypothetical protein
MQKEPVNFMTGIFQKTKSDKIIITI